MKKKITIKADKIAALLNYQMILYGDIFEQWLHEEGTRMFLEYAKKKGIEYMDLEGINGYDILKNTNA